jgi:hypothetical protein
MCWRTKFKITGQVYEGDDGLFCGIGKPPTPEFAEKCGLLLKIEEKKRNEASFCGMIFEPHSYQCIKDPVHVLARFGWCLTKRKLTRDPQGLLKAKALSLFYELPACPVLTTLAKSIIRQTAKTRPIFERDWKTRNMLLRDVHDLNIVISNDTRKLFEKVFHVPVKLQFELESALEAHDFSRPLSHTVFDRLIESSRSCLCVEDCVAFSKAYVEQLKVGTPMKYVHHQLFMPVMRGDPWL